LAEESLHRRLGFAHVDQPPVIFARHRIDIALPQEANVVRLLQLINRAGIVTELPVVQPDRAHILLAPVHRLHLAIALQRLGHLRRRHAKCKQD
jgi:hypothetical protein